MLKIKDSRKGGNTRFKDLAVGDVFCHISTRLSALCTSASPRIVTGANTYIVFTGQRWVICEVYDIEELVTKLEATLHIE